MKITNKLDITKQPVKMNKLFYIMAKSLLQIRRISRHARGWIIEEEK